MDANSGESGNNNDNDDFRLISESDIVGEDEEILKRRISSHPLYGLLIETHLNCLKVALGDNGEVGKTNAENQSNLKPEATSPTSSEVDHFMGAYCMTLSKLKEVMEEPIQETTSFINATYSQLRELSETHPHNPKPNPPGNG